LVWQKKRQATLMKKMVGGWQKSDWQKEKK
jgi:hypothetical protein